MSELIAVLYSVVNFVLISLINFIGISVLLILAFIGLRQVYPFIIERFIRYD